MPAKPGSKFNAVTRRFEPPAEGASNGTSAPVRVQIKQMTGHANEEEMAASLPTNTMETPVDAPKRAYRKKTEAAVDRDPNMDDPVFVESLKKLQGYGVPRLVKGAFAVAEKAMDKDDIRLNRTEEGEVDAYFYVLSKKYGGLDPSKHWLSMLFYFTGMIGSFIVSRVMENSESFQMTMGKFFNKEEEPEPVTETKEGSEQEV